MATHDVLRAMTPERAIGVLRHMDHHCCCSDVCRSASAAIMYAIRVIDERERLFEAAELLLADINDGVPALEDAVGFCRCRPWANGSEHGSGGE